MLLPGTSFSKELLPAAAAAAAPAAPCTGELSSRFTSESTDLSDPQRRLKSDGLKKWFGVAAEESTATNQEAAAAKLRESSMHVECSSWAAAGPEGNNALRELLLGAPILVATNPCCNQSLLQPILVVTNPCYNPCAFLEAIEVYGVRSTVLQQLP
eukprot:SAG11_NODE_114_length_16040_cov_10.050875_18_plen_156_part_00